MHLFVDCPREARLDSSVASPETPIEMVTINGVRTAAWEKEIGSIEVGKKAHFIVLECNRPEWRPLFNTVSSLVFNANGDSVETVVVNGNLVMENHRILTFAEHMALEGGQRRAEAVAERAGLTKYSKWTWPQV